MMIKDLEEDLDQPKKGQFSTNLSVSQELVFAGP
jgi:hypothetical protein